MLNKRQNPAAMSGAESSQDLRPFALPAIEALRGARNVLLAGAGGGYDVLAALPIYFALKSAGKRVHLANLSFADLRATDAACIGGTLFRVDADTTASVAYVPELHVARWLARIHGDGTPIYAIERSGVQPTTGAYASLMQAVGDVDSLVLVDGGTDILMRGDEVGLGTPEEDIASLAAAAALSGVERKIVACIGFGIDAFHGVCHANVLASIAALAAEGAFLGAWSLTPGMPEVDAYLDAVDYVSRAVPAAASIVNTSIASAIRGRFGDHHATARTAESELFINPLMAMYWTFDLPAVARRNLYIDRVRTTRTYRELTLGIERFRAETQDRTGAWTPLPF
ncbi:MAG: hypothetical protein JWM87_2765 [Candidatus Eremiobacteraeota bacterium]|nr:hypothetical protein [Candidatus Eremiobacteraeota bacterium]